LNNTDVLVSGGHPAGSIAATLLVERGCRVVVLQKEHQPRFHIGASLLSARSLGALRRRPTHLKPAEPAQMTSC
jgi:flavin-dependent dehydrogenase